MSEFEISVSSLDGSSPAAVALREVLSMWDSWRGSQPFPSWKQVDMLDLPHELLPWTIVADCRETPDGMDFVYRYWGSDLSAALGLEMSGKSYRELPDEVFRNATAAVYGQVRSRRAPILFKGRFVAVSGAVYEDLALRLPIGDDDETVDKVMSIVAVKTAWGLHPGDPVPPTIY